MKILVSKDDDLLYVDLIRFLYEIDLLQGHTALNSTLRRHSKLRNYLHNKQKEMLEEVESDYFMPDGTLNLDALEELNHKYSVDKINSIN